MKYNLELEKNRCIGQMYEFSIYLFSSDSFKLCIENWSYIKTNMWCVKYIPIRVLPVPGGPKRRRPLGGPRNPVKMSLKCINFVLHIGFFL